MITSSQVERLIECPASAVLPQMRSTSVASQRGVEGHAVLERAATIGLDAALEELGEDPFSLRAQLLDLDLSDMPVGEHFAQEVAVALDLSTGKARELGRGIPRDEAYKDLGPFDVAAIIDVLGVADDHIFVGDWKFGWSERPVARKNYQLKTSALIASRAYGLDEARVALFRLPEQGTAWQSRATFDVFDLDEHEVVLRDLHKRVAVERGNAEAIKVNMGPWCHYCPSMASCPGQTATLRAIEGGGLQRRVDDLKPYTKASFAKAWRTAKILKAIHSKLQGELTMFVKHHGPVDLGDGRIVVNEICDGVEKFDGDTAYQVLCELRGEHVANAAVTLSTTKKAIKAALKSDLGADEKLAPLERQTHDTIRNRGGASRKRSERVRVIEPKPEKKELAQ